MGLPRICLSWQEPSGAGDLGKCFNWMSFILASYAQWRQVQQSPTLSIFAAAIKAAGLENTLNGRLSGHDAVELLSGFLPQKHVHPHARRCSTYGRRHKVYFICTDGWCFSSIGHWCCNVAADAGESGRRSNLVLQILAHVEVKHASCESWAR